MGGTRRGDERSGGGGGQGIGGEPDERRVSMVRWSMLGVFGVDAGGGVTQGVKLLILRTVLHNMKLSSRNSFGELHTERL